MAAEATAEDARRRRRRRRRLWRRLNLAAAKAGRERMRLQCNEKILLAHKSLRATGRGRALEVRASASACDSSRAGVANGRRVRSSKKKGSTFCLFSPRC